MLKTATSVLLLAAISPCVRAQTPRAFTALHRIQFVAGTDQIRKLVSADPAARGIAEGKFSVAREDLNDDGSPELILLAEDSMNCGSGGCGLVVLELRAGKITRILYQNVGGTLAVTNEKVGDYRALSSVDEKGTILVEDRRGAPGFGTQYVYPMDVSRSAAQPRSAPAQTTGVATAICASALCTENLEFAATITDFRAILENTNSKTLTVRVSFRNKLRRPLVLGYVSRSGVATDDRGNRYVPSGQRGIQGIGEIVGNSADSKFALQPDESSDARFEFIWNTSGLEIFGVTFQLDLAIREIVPMPGNQLRLGKEYALHFDRLGNSAPSRTATMPPPGDDAGRSSVARPAPVPPDAPPQVDACRGKPRGTCVSTGVFVAEIAGVITSFANTSHIHIIQANVMFKNITNQPIVLGYMVRSGVITDTYGGRYTEGSMQNDGARGIGIVQRNDADSQFVLTPGASSNAAFVFARSRPGDLRDPLGDTFNMDLTIAHLEALPSRQIRTVREYSVGFTGLTASAMGPRATMPASAGGASPQGDACGAKAHCYATGTFTAEITDIASSFANTNHTHILEAKLLFRNLTDQPISLAYLVRSGVITDNYGGRYTEGSMAGDGARGIGLLNGHEIDPQFTLKAGASGTASFMFVRARPGDLRDPVGTAFNFDVVVAQVEELPGRQMHIIRQYAVTVPNATASGGGARSVLENILKGLPKKVPPSE